MPAESVIERSFTGGELAPALYARVDHQKYQTGLRTLRNRVCMRHGGVTQRPGTQYVGTTLNGGNPIREIPFIFNETGLGQSYVLEFGNQYITFYQNGGNVVASQPPIIPIRVQQITAISQANPGTLTINDNLTSILNFGDIVFINNIPGMTQLNNHYFKINTIFSSINSFISLADLNGNPIDTTNYSAFVPNNASQTIAIDKLYIITTPYLQADLQNLKFAQSADVITITHQNYPIYELRRLAPTNWTLTQPILGAPLAGPPNLNAAGTPAGAGFAVNYYVTSVNATGQESDNLNRSYVFVSGVTPAAASTPVTVSWTAQPGAVSYRIYTVQYSSTGNILGSQITPGYIGSTTNTSFTDGGIVPDFTNQFPVNPGLFVGVGNYPANCGFVQQRRYFSNTINNPVGFWGSQPGNYSNFDYHITGQDDDGIFGSLASDEVNAIQAVLEQKFMLMLTAGAEIFVQGNGSGIVTPSAINASTQSQYGCSPLKPLKVGDVLLFNQALGSFIRDFCFDFVIDGYRGNDITVFSSHLFEGHQIVDWAYQKVPDSIIWAVREDGVLLSCTYVREQQILAWARHDFTNGFVENVCAIPENGEYAVYVSMRRVINGATVRYIERLSSRIWLGPALAVAAGTALAVGDPIDAQYVDCNSVYDGRNVQLAPAQISVITGTNDDIPWEDPAGTPYFAIIPSGIYTPAQLATKLTTVMNASYGGDPYNITFNGTNFVFSSAGNIFKLTFNSSDPYYPTSIAPTLGFLATDYSALGSPVIAPNPPIYVPGTGQGPIQMYLSTPPLSYIEQGVNDGIDFGEPLLGNVPLHATIPAGNYASPIALAIAIGKAMTAIGQQTYVGSLVGGFISITAPPSGTFVITFDPTHTTGFPVFKPGNAGVYLGFQPFNYTIAGGSTLTATNQGEADFYASGSDAYQQQMLLNSQPTSTAYFTPAMVGDEFFINDPAFIQSQGARGQQIRVTVQSYISPVQVIVTPNKVVLGELRGQPLSTWVHAVKTVSGLTYLAGQQVSVWADRFVVGSPLNATVTKGIPYIVSPQGTLTLDNCYGVICVGLPMIADFETLAIDTTFGDSILEETKSITQVVVSLYQTRGFFGGTQNPDTDPDNLGLDPYENVMVLDPLFNLLENKAQENRQTYDQAPPMMTDTQYTNIECNWSKEGRIFIRNVDPTPQSILAVVPAGLTSAKVAWSQKV